LKRNRRKRGGQKGNQNARKHGFYSPALTPAETDQLWTSIEIEGVDPRVALIRTKLLSSLQHHPANPRVIAQASRLLAKAYSDMYALDAADHDYLKTLIDLILESALKACSPTSTGSTTRPNSPDETNRSHLKPEQAPRTPRNESNAPCN